MVLQLVTDVGLKELCVDSSEIFLPVLHGWLLRGKKNAAFMKGYLRIIQSIAFIGLGKVILFRHTCVKWLCHEHAPVRGLRYFRYLGREHILIILAYSLYFKLITKKQWLFRALVLVCMCDFTRGS